jgi:hypothetical protein
MSEKTYTDNNGYERFTDSDMLVHRLVAENKVGGEIYPERVVHHIDGDKTNNAPSNLEIMSRSEHSRLHAQERYEDDNCISEDEEDDAEDEDYAEDSDDENDDDVEDNCDSEE